MAEEIYKQAAAKQAADSKQSADTNPKEANEATQEPGGGAQADEVIDAEFKEEDGKQ